MMPTIEFLTTIGDSEIEFPLQIEYHYLPGYKGDRYQPPEDAEYQVGKIRIITECGWVTVRNQRVLRREMVDVTGCPSIEAELESQQDRLDIAMCEDWHGRDGGDDRAYDEWRDKKLMEAG